MIRASPLFLSHSEFVFEKYWQENAKTRNSPSISWMFWKLRKKNENCSLLFWRRCWFKPRLTGRIHSHPTADAVSGFFQRTSRVVLRSEGHTIPKVSTVDLWVKARSGFHGHVGCSPVSKAGVVLVFQMIAQTVSMNKRFGRGTYVTK